MTVLPCGMLAGWLEERLFGPLEDCSATTLPGLLAGHVGRLVGPEGVGRLLGPLIALAGRLEGPLLH